MRYPAPSDDSAPAEMHDEESKGWWIPNEVLRLYSDVTSKNERLSPRQLNAEEMMLLSKIHALCQRKNGCTASNGWLATWWDKKEWHVSTTLSKFREMGLLRVETTKGNRRHLFTSFPAAEKHGEGSCDKSPGAMCKTTRAHVVNHKGTDILEKTSKRTSTREAGAVPGESDFGLEEKDTTSHPKASLFVQKFLHLATQNRWLLGTKGFSKQGAPTPRTARQWRKAINELLQGASVAEVRDVMKWYFENWEGPFVPSCHTLPSFCDKFVKVRSAMQRSTKSAPADNQATNFYGDSVSEEWKRANGYYEVAQESDDCYVK